MFKHRDGERGQVLVLFTVVLVVLMVLTALVVDVGVLRRSGQELWKAMDAGALAGAAELPGGTTAAADAGRRIATTDFPGVDPADIAVSFRCVVGDRNHNDAPDSGDLPAVCDPGTVSKDGWRCANGFCAAPCAESPSTRCNTIVLSSEVSANYEFGRSIGVNHASTRQVQSAACVGPCGTTPTAPVDLMLILDRSSSMSNADLAELRAASNEVLKLYDPGYQHIGLGILGPSLTTSGCSGSNSPALGMASISTMGPVTWTPVGLTGIGAPVNERYRMAGGAVNRSSTLAKTIACFSQSRARTIMSTATDRAGSYLVANSRPGARKGIILMTDGLPNGDTCGASSTAATAAMTAGIEFFTIGYGIDETSICPDRTGPWQGKPVADLLAAMASGSTNEGCTTAENADGDHYYCQPRTGDLAVAFKSAASALARETRLIALP